MKFAWIAVEKAAFRVNELCRALRVSSSGFYAWTRRRESAHAQRDRQLRVSVRASFEGSKHRYGSPRIHRDHNGASGAPWICAGNLKNDAGRS